MKNKYEIRGDVTAIFAKCKGYVVETIVDTSKLYSLYGSSWSAIYDETTKSHYIMGRFSCEKKTVQLHRFLTNATKGIQVDHRNRDTLDNRMNNLRLVTQSENQQNTKTREDNTSGCLAITDGRIIKKYSVCCISFDHIICKYRI